MYELLVGVLLPFGMIPFCVTLTLSHFCVAFTLISCLQWMLSAVQMMENIAIKSDMKWEIFFYRDPKYIAQPY